MLHENITTSDKFSKVGFEAECLYNRLLTQTDDYGNVRGSIGYIKDVCFPKNKLNKKIDYQMVGKWLSECLQIGLLCGYQVDGIEYLHFNRFEDFQTLRKDRIKNSSIPMFTPMQPSGNQVDNQVVTKCQHELEVEVKEEVKYSSEFESVFFLYPSHRRTCKKDCYKYFKQIPKDKVDIFTKNLMAYISNNEKENYKYVKQSQRYFKDWETVIDAEVIVIDKPKTRYEIELERINDRYAIYENK